MRLASLTRVKNDGDIIEEFVRYTARFVDALVVVDNASLDSTRDVLSALHAEGLPLTILEDGFIEGYDWIMTDLVRKVLAQTDADYLLVLDADEFVRSPSRAALEHALSELAPGSHACVPWVTYVPTPDDDALEQRQLVRIRHRLRDEAPAFYKVFVSRSFLACPDATLRVGNHGVDDPLERHRNVELPNVDLAHVPVRSIAQIQNKGFLGWSSFMAMGYEGGGLAYQWQRVYEHLGTKQDWTASDLFECAVNYLAAPGTDHATVELTCDPLRPVERRYATSVPDLTQTAIAYTRQLARSYATLQRENMDLRRALGAAPTTLEAS